jgi:hypothetical protein
MLSWETDASRGDTELGAAFADAWCAIPKVEFSRTLDSVQGNARSPRASLAEEVAAALQRLTRTSRSAAPAWPRGRSSSASSTSCACSGNPVVVGGGTPFLPAVIEDVPLELIETRTFGLRVIYERYRRARDESD